MPLAHKSRLIAGLLQEWRKGGLRTVEAISVAQEAVEMAMFSCEDAGPRGSANRVCTERVGEHSAFFGNAIDIRSLIDARTVGPDGLDRMVVAENKDDVGSLVRR